MTKNQEGFSLPETLGILLIFIVIATVGYFVWGRSNQNKSHLSTSSSQVKTSPLSQVVSESPAQWEKSTGKEFWGTVNNFQSNRISFRYPIIGWHMFSQTWNSYSSLSRIFEDSGYGTSTNGAQFAITIWMSKSARTASSFQGQISPSMGNTIGTLKNGIKVWQSNKATFDHSNLLYCSKGKFNHVVQLSAQSDQGLYFKLPNGRYMTYIARFCQEDYRQDLNASFEAQANSKEMLVAARILGSIQFQPKWTSVTAH